MGNCLVIFVHHIDLTIELSLSRFLPRFGLLASSSFKLALLIFFLPQLLHQPLLLILQLPNLPLICLLLSLPPLQLLLEFLILDDDNKPYSVQIIRNEIIKIPKNLQKSTNYSQNEERKTQTEVDIVPITVIVDERNYQKYNKHAICQNVY
jgi:hypothetical protein